jgi:hypothetical protein
VLADDRAPRQVAPPPQSTRLADLEAAAAMRFQALYGEPAAAWSIRRWLGSAAPLPGGALPRAARRARAGMAVRQMALLEIVPQFVAVFNVAARQARRLVRRAARPGADAARATVRGGGAAAPARRGWPNTRRAKRCA